MFEELTYRQLQPHLIGTRDNLDTENRIAPELKEVIVDADVLDAEHLGPNVRQPLFGGRARCDIGLA